MKTPETAKAYEWDWDKPAYLAVCEKFSIGIFQWIPTKNGKSLKRAKVVKRIKGLTANPEEVFQMARAECERRNKEGGMNHE
jgi:hypothetical protein